MQSLDDIFGGGAQGSFDTPLSPDEEAQFQAWKQKYAPKDSGVDYDLRGAFKEGLTPDPKTGHWPDTYKKPNHPTFSVESKYAKDAPDKAGHWDGETYIPADKTSSLDDIFGDVKRETSETPTQGLSREQRLEALKKPLPGEETIPNTGVNLPILGKVDLPTAGGMVGPLLVPEAAAASKIPILGSLVSPVNTALSAAGGAVGTVADEALRVAAGLPAPSASDVTSRVAGNAAKQGALQAAGEGVLGSLAKTLNPMSNETIRSVFPSIEKALDLPEGSKSWLGQIYKGIVEGFYDQGRAKAGAAYDRAEAAAAADPKAVTTPTRLAEVKAKWQKTLTGAPSESADQSWLNWVAKHGEAPPPEKAPAGFIRPEPVPKEPPQLHFTQLNNMRKTLSEEAYKPSLPGSPGASTAMLRELADAAAEDMERVPNPEVQALAKDARETFKAYVAPFKQGKAKDLPNLIGKSPEDYVDAFSRKGSSQAIRELKNVAALHPETGEAGLQTLRENTLRNVLDDSKSMTVAGERFDGRKMYGIADRMGDTLDQLYGEGYSKGLKEVARKLMTAQGASRPRIGTFALEGALAWTHPYIGVPLMLGTQALSSFMRTPAGLRYLSEGILPGVQKALTSQTARVAGGAFAKSLATDQETPTVRQERQQLESLIGPEQVKQLKVQQPGPNGEAPLSQIGGAPHPLDPVLAVAATNNGLSPQLLKATATTESGLNPKATSPKHAQGVMQLMAGTARDMGVKDTSDPVENINGGAKYLSQLMQQFQGNKALALAAYNAGPDAVTKYGGIPPYPETQKYVKDVLAREQQYMADREGLGAPSKRDMSWSEISDLYQRARRTDDQGAWKTIRGQINRRVNANRDKPMFGMSAQEYKRLYPAIMKATRPEMEENVTTALSG